MESQSQRKWVISSFIFVAALVAYVAFAAALNLSGYFDLETKLKNVELIIRLSSLGLGVLLMVALLKSETANQFMHEVVAELSRVTWPTKDETFRTLWWVLGLVVVTGIFLALVDRFWTHVIQWIL